MKLSIRSCYTLRLLMDLAEHGNGTPITLKTIAQRRGISIAYLRHLVIPLEARGFIHSIRGNKGGYLLSTTATQTNLYELITLAEGPIDLVQCVEHERSCERSASCPTRPLWQELSAIIKTHLSRYTVLDLLAMKLQPSSLTVNPDTDSG